jgi:YD repeat-containing protein
MTRMSIRHQTRYLYGQPVRFGVHRMLLRPRDSHAGRIISATLELYPSGRTTWTYDALGNCVCWYQPDGESNELEIVSNLVLDRFPAQPVALAIQDPNTAAPINYAIDDRAVLAPFIAPASDADAGVLQWVRERMGPPHEPVLDFLNRLNMTIHQGFAYGPRHEEGVQSPAQTLQRGAGTCRDFAWLMIEALRILGYAARFVTGYLHSQHGRHVGAGATHAWCEVFLPDIGWIEFDPTNGLMESTDLIRVATTRTPGEASPVLGAIIGNPNGWEMFVDVDVRIIGP